jgi:hypothetical protein
MISIASYSFHGLLEAGRIDLFGYLESCRFRYHLDTADIWNGMLLSLEDDHLSKVKDALVERNLTLVNLCVDGPHIWDNDPAVREQHYQEAKRYLRAAEYLGARTLRIDAGGSAQPFTADETFTEEQYDLIISRYKEYSQWAYDHGFKVGPENHWGPEVVPANMQRICRGVDHQGFGVLLHFRGNEGDATIATYAMHTHISWDITETSLEGSLAMLHNAGYGGCWGVEHHSATNEYNQVAIQLARVRSVVKDW